MNEKLPSERIRQTLVTRANDARAMHAWAGHCMAERPLEALRWSRRACVTEPLAPPPRHRVALALWQLGRVREADAAGRRGVILDPREWQAWINIGNVRKRQGDTDAALRTCDRARAAGAPFHMAGMNAAVLRLRRGEFAVGWPLYRARHKTLGADPTTIWPDVPEWDGRPLAGRLRLVTEQGIGDAVMFLTLIAAVRERVGALTLLVTNRLKPLIRRSFPDIQVEAPDEHGVLVELPDAEAWICAGDVPAALDVFTTGTARPRPYLRVDPNRRQRLRETFERRHPGKRLVGITWTSQADDGWRRTIAPSLWHPISDIGDVALISLQYRATKGDMAAFGDRLDVTHGIEPFHDLDGLAALVAAMDMVVSPTNNTVHFAGALGLPCHVMLPVDPDWRWGEDGCDCRWYEGTRLHRQRRDGDWAPVIESVARALRRKDTPAS